MENWQMELAVVGQKPLEVKIRRGTFKGDSLLPLLFVIAMM